MVVAELLFELAEDYLRVFLVLEKSVGKNGQKLLMYMV